MHSYTLGVSRSQLGHVVGSTEFFVTMVNTIVAGVLGALIAWASGAVTAVIVVSGVGCGLLYFAAMMELGRRSFGTTHQRSMFPTPD
jgi:hypothetical protein